MRAVRPLPAGKLNRGMSVVDTVEIIKGSSLSETEYLHAALLGWCVELVRAMSAISWAHRHVPANI